MAELHSGYQVSAVGVAPCPMRVDHVCAYDSRACHHGIDLDGRPSWLWCTGYKQARSEGPIARVDLGKRTIRVRRVPGFECCGEVHYHMSIMAPRNDAERSGMTFCGVDRMWEALRQAADFWAQYPCD